MDPNSKNHGSMELAIGVGDAVELEFDRALDPAFESKTVAEVLPELFGGRELSQEAIRTVLADVRSCLEAYTSGSDEDGIEEPLSPDEEWRQFVERHMRNRSAESVTSVNIQRQHKGGRSGR